MVVGGVLAIQGEGLQGLVHEDEGTGPLLGQDPVGIEALPRGLVGAHRIGVAGRDQRVEGRVGPPGCMSVKCGMTLWHNGVAD